jgi:DNA-binding CsgD family transcriptional regulator
MITQPLNRLSPREKQLLRRFAQGKSDKKIVQEIGGTEKQVAEQRQALIKKLRIQFDGQLMAAADELAPWPKHRKDGGDTPPP